MHYVRRRELTLLLLAPLSFLFGKAHRNRLDRFGSLRLMPVHSPNLQIQEVGTTASHRPWRLMLAWRAESGAASRETIPTREEDMYGEKGEWLGLLKA